MSDQPQDTTGVEEAAGADHAAVQGRVTGRDGGPQDPDAMAAADDLSAPQSVGDEYDEMLERGAKQRGEGRVP